MITLQVVNSIAMASAKHKRNVSRMALELGVNRITLYKYIDRGWEIYLLKDGTQLRETVPLSIPEPQPLRVLPDE